MKITDVQVIVLESPQSYGASEGSEEAHGIKYLGIVKVTTDAGITGYADLETQPHVARAIVDAPSEGSVTGFLGCAAFCSAKIRSRSSGCGTRCIWRPSTMAAAPRSR